MRNGCVRRSLCFIYSLHVFHIFPALLSEPCRPLRSLPPASAVALPSARDSQRAFAVYAMYCVLEHVFVGLTVRNLPSFFPLLSSPPSMTALWTTVRYAVESGSGLLPTHCPGQRGILR
jgi:hypothetical protein